ncbi:MAG: 8-oxoguanine deaminase [Phycisphaerae bacterium]|nr:8-oxoguanine deaminase [Phycisphaerae bacterium]
MTDTIFNGTLIAHRDGAPIVSPCESISIGDGVITEVQLGDGGADGAARTADGRSERFDASGHVILPGLINTHHHLYQSLTRCLRCVQDASLFDWLTQLYKRWRHIDYSSVKLAAQISIAELQFSGCTTTSDHFYIFPRGTDARLEAVLDAAEEMGMRIHACRGSMSVGHSAGGLPPDDCVEDERAILQDCERAMDRFHDGGEHSMRRIDLAPCSPFSVSPELMKDVASLARSRGALLHTHAAETLDEEEYCLNRFGARPIDLLDSLDWLGPDVYLAHCVCLNHSDICRLAETKTGIAHCPSSNMRLGSGIPPVRALLDAGGRVGLGVDGSSSNDGGHLLAEARQALLLQRAARGPLGLSVAEAFSLGTVGSAEVLNRPRLGNIAAGFSADLAMFRRDDLSLAGAIEQDPLGAIMLCRTARVDRLIINGRTVIEDGRHKLVDLPALIERFNRLVRERFSFQMP